MTKEQEDYFEIKYISRVTDYKIISDRELELSESDARKLYTNKGGIDKYICECIDKSSKKTITNKDFEKIKSYFKDYHELDKKYYKKARKNLFMNVEKFMKWYKEQNQTCCYCGIHEDKLGTYFNHDNEQYKYARQRGKVLEIERVFTAIKKPHEYEIDNCRLACYICNNAKSDFISAKSFKPIAKGINKFWVAQGIDIQQFKEDDEIWEIDTKV